MPTYDYACDECGYHFEEFQSITAAPLTKCPKCSGRIRRLIGAGNGFLFKGNGFYVTDYRSDSYKNAQKREQDSATRTNDSPAPPTPEKDLSSKTMAYNAVKKAE